MKKRVISISLLFIIAIFLISTYNYPLRQSEDVICKNIMEKIPLGTSFSEVFEQIGKERKWVIDTIFIGDGDFVSGYDMDLSQRKVFINNSRRNDYCKYRKIYGLHIQNRRSSKL